jgi:hypothetical protein
MSGEIGGRYMASEPKKIILYACKTGNKKWQIKTEESKVIPENETFQIVITIDQKLYSVSINFIKKQSTINPDEYIIDVEVVKKVCLEIDGILDELLTKINKLEELLKKKESLKNYQLKKKKNQKKGGVKI